VKNKIYLKGLLDCKKISIISRVFINNIILQKKAILAPEDAQDGR
jgi:hypothetical protein